MSDPLFFKRRIFLFTLLRYRLACLSRCTDPLHSHNHCKRTTLPRLAPPHLPPLSKGGGLTARHKLLLCCFLLVIRLPFQFIKLFCRQDGGDCVCLEDLKIVLLSISIPTVTARNSFRIVKVGLSEYCTASQKIISAVPPPLFRGEARVLAICYILRNRQSVH